VARHWATLGPTLVVITLGGEGAFAVHADQETRRTAPPIKVVDTVGAGDAFTAGLSSALRSAGRGTPATIRDLDLDLLSNVIDQAIHAASVTCTRAGADTPHRSDLWVSGSPIRCRMPRAVHAPLHPETVPEPRQDEDVPLDVTRSSTT
jgi:fructokinase